MRIRASNALAVVALTLVSALVVLGQQPARAPTLLFHETFKENAPGTPEQAPLAPDHVMNPNLELTLYGPGATAAPDHESGLLRANAVDPVTGNSFSYVWSGVTEGSWAVTLKDRDNYLDLTGMAKVRWRVRMRGFNVIRPVIVLGDGTMLAADYEETESSYFRENEVYLVDIPRWRVLDPTQIVGARDARWRTNVDLSRVDEIGFTDLSRGAGHGQGGNSGLDWIEVYGHPVSRSASGR